MEHRHSACGAASRAFRPIRSATALVAAACAAAVSTAPVEAQGALEEMTVTARFRRENLQQTPLAITAVSGAMLEARGATSTVDLDAYVPNAVIAPLGAGWGSTAAVFVRGIGLGDNSLSFEPGVPIYIDDVYHGRPQGAVLDLLDIERVEVLRGPQGTLFGKNTLGGAVRIISRKPQGDGSSFLDVGIGSRERLNVRGSYDFAIGEKVFARFSASSKRQDGYFDILDYECIHGAGSLGPGGPGIEAGVFNNNTILSTALTTHPAIEGVALGSVLPPGEDSGCVADQLGDENVQSARFAVRLLRSERLEINVITDLTTLDQQGPADKYTIQLRTTDGVPPSVRTAINTWNDLVAVPVFGQGGQFDGRFQTDDGFTGYHRFGYDPLSRRTTPNVNDLTHWGLQATVDWDLASGVHFKSTTSMREFENSFGRDSDGTPLPQLFTWDESKHDQFTQEFQLSGTSGRNDALDWTAGFFYYDAKDSNEGYVTTFVYTSTFSDQKDVQDLENFALFAHADWRITDKLRLSGGLRYTDDSKRATILRMTANVAPPVIGISQLELVPNTEVVAEAEEWSPMIGLDYRFSDTVMGYAQISTGFRGGGFGPRPANEQQVATFEPEFVDNFEIGIKSDWLDGRLRFNGDVYWMENTDKQLPTQTCGPCAPVVVAWFRTVNTGESRNWGLETEILAQPTDALRLDFSLGYQNYEVTDLGSATGLFVRVPETTGDPSIRGDVLFSPRTPEWTLGLGAQYTFRVGTRGATLVPRVDYNWQDDIWFTTNPVAGIVDDQDGRQPAYGVVNGRITYTPGAARWSLSAYALNLTDEYYFFGKLSLLANSGREQGNPAPPREIGVNVRFEF